MTALLNGANPKGSAWTTLKVAFLFLLSRNRPCHLVRHLSTRDLHQSHSELALFLLSR